MGVQVIDSKKIKTLYLIYLMFSCFLCDYFCDLLRFKRFLLLSSFQFQESKPEFSYKSFIFTAILRIMQYDTTRINDEQTFLACKFCFPNSDHVMFSREFAFVFSLIMHTYARGCTCIRRHLEETVLWGIITRSEVGKQKGLLRNGSDKNDSNNGNEHVGIQKRC